LLKKKGDNSETNNVLETTRNRARVTYNERDDKILNSELKRVIKLFRSRSARFLSSSERPDPRAGGSRRVIAKYSGSEFRWRIL